jgi:tRNA (adenine37-N6)-methyltransferase
MKDLEIPFKAIGVIHSEHAVAEQTPIQSVFARGCQGRVEVFSDWAAGLRDLEGFSHIYLIYFFHQCGPARMIVKPFLQDIERGLFSTRAPCRPNAIGLSIVELLSRDGNILYVDNLDILDGTPLLDIKPYTRRFDRIETTRNGWQDLVDDETARRKGVRDYGRIPEGSPDVDLP